MDKKISKYLEKQKSPQKEICKKLRNIILKTFPNISEETKWGALVYDGGKFYIGVVKLGVNLGFSVNQLTEKEMGQFNGKGKFMRHIKVVSEKDIDEKKIVMLLNLVKK
jgi:hypothetical protein